MTANAKGLKNLVILGAVILTAQTSALSEEVFGPVNYFHTIKTPFGGGGSQPAGEEATAPDELAPIGLTRSERPNLMQRLGQARLYLPDKMCLGRTCEFTIKGKPHSWVAIAMADKNEGAKAIHGHPIRLGSDRKVVAIGQIPDSGVRTLNIETPIQGDLIGSSLYFEAAIWSKEDMSDVEIAATIPSEGTAKESNGVLIAAEPDTKRGIRLVPQTSIPGMRQTALQQGTLSP